MFRLVVAGDKMTEYSSQGDVFYFDQAYGLSQAEVHQFIRKLIIMLSNFRLICISIQIYKEAVNNAVY